MTQDAEPPFARYERPLTGLFRFGRWMSRRHLIVLTYHRVLPDRCRTVGPRPRNAVFAAEFERQMAYLVRRHHIVTGDELRAHLTSPRRSPLPSYSVLLTFDDGYANNYSQALPVLRRYGMSAIFFLTTALIGRPGARLWFDRLDVALTSSAVRELLPTVPGAGSGPVDLRRYIKRLPAPAREEMIARLERGATTTASDDEECAGLLSWDQVRAMASEGMTIGSHGVTHQVLAGAGAEEVRAEVQESRRRIEEELGTTCWSFSYPNGEASDVRSSDRAEVRVAGYLCAFTQMPGPLTARSDAYALPRTPVPDSGAMGVFYSRVSGVSRWVSAARRLGFER